MLVYVLWLLFTSLLCTCIKECMQLTLIFCFHIRFSKNFTGNFASFTEHYTEVVKEIPQPEELSGLMLIFPMHCVHILEVGNWKTRKFSFFPFSFRLTVFNMWTRQWIFWEWDKPLSWLEESSTLVVSHYHDTYLFSRVPMKVYWNTWGTFENRKELCSLAQNF